MPGIAGIISKKKSKGKNEKDLHSMINCMMHEPFYTSGAYINHEMGVYAGWVSHKDSFSDCMPVFNEKKDIVLLFAGENFSDKEALDQLREKGHDFDPSNASYLVHLYEEEGLGFLRRLNGWFCGVLVDLKEGMAFLFNDRYSMGKVYYHEGEDGLFFSSEAKSILKIKPELKKLNDTSLGEFFSCGAVLQNKTLFPGIFLLPGGSLWTYREGTRIEKENYFSSREWEEQPPIADGLFYEEFKQTFRSILPRYFSTPQPLAISLTGGLDTRMIMANMNTAPRTLRCFTFGGMYRDCFDVKIARRIAKECGQPYEVIPIGRDFLSDFSKYAEKTVYLTDGGLDVLASHEVYINRKAREIAPVRLTGNYGSEILRSINYIKANLPDERLFCPDFYKNIKTAKDTFNHTNQGNQLSYAAFKLIPWYLYGRLAAAQSQLTVRTPFMDNDLVCLMYRAPTVVRADKETSLRIITDGNPALARIMTDRGVGGDHGFLWSKLARLYREVLFKAEYAYNDGMSHWLAKCDYSIRMLRPELLFLGRHKIESYRAWLRDDLSSYLQDTLLDAQSLNRAYLNKDFLKKIVDAHIYGKGNYARELNRVLTAELVQRTLIEQS